MLYNDAGNDGQGGRRKKTDVLEWVFREAEEKEIHSSRPAVVQEDHALQKEIKEVRIINEKKTLPAEGRRNTACILQRQSVLSLKRDTCRSESLSISRLSLIWKMKEKNAGEWEKLDNLPEEWEEAYDVNTETEVLSYKK